MAELPAGRGASLRDVGIVTPARAYGRPVGRVLAFSRHGRTRQSPLVLGLSDNGPSA